MKEYFRLLTNYSPSRQIAVCGGSDIYIGFKSVLMDTWPYYIIFPE